MTDFRTTKQSTYSTPFDVRQILTIFEREVYNEEDDVQEKQSITDSRIEQNIYGADSFINSYLVSVYGASALLESSPYFLGPVGLIDNESQSTLRGIVIATTAITEQWLIKFTAENAFTVTATVSGGQGSGTIGVDFTSTNSDVEIKAEDWALNGATAISANNRFLFGTYLSKPIIRMMSAKLAASDLINAYYSLAESESSTWARQLRKEVLDLLKAFIDPNSDVSLVTINEATIGDTEAVGWDINRDGDDVSTYKPDGSINTMDI